MKHLLYIDGEQADVSENTQITLELQSNLFQDIAKIAANRTYTIKLPKTGRNRRIFEHSDKPQANTTFPYQSHVADYFRGGVQLITNGTLYLLSSTDDFECSIVWGVNDALQSVFNAGLKLNEMPEGNDRLYFDRYNHMKYWSSRNDRYGYFVCNYLDYPEEMVDRNWMLPYLSQYAFSRFPNMGYVVPCARMRFVLDKIQSLYGITFSMSADATTLVDDMLIPLTGLVATSISLASYTFMAVNNASTIIAPNAGVELAPSVTNVLFDDSSSNKVRYEVATDCQADINVNITVKSNEAVWLNTIVSAFENDTLFARAVVYHSSNYYDDRDDYELKDTITVTDSNGIEIDFDNYTNAKDIFTINIQGEAQNVELSKGDLVGGVLMRIGTYYSGYTGAPYYIDSAIFTVQFHDVEKLIYGMYYPIIANLPEIKIVDLLKYVAFMTGTYPQMVRGNSVTFIPIETIWSNKSNAVDWSDKLIASNTENNPREMVYQLDGWAKANIYKYKDNDEVEDGTGEGVINVDDATLDDERTAYEFPFCASRYNNIPMYPVDDDATETQADELLFPNSDQTDDPIDGKSATPRIMHRGYMQITNPNDDSQYLTFATAVFSEKLYAQTSIDAFYTNYKASLQHIRVIKEQFRLNDVELLTFDETKPVYIKQYGKYYAVLKLESSESGIAKATLFQLNL